MVRGCLIDLDDTLIDDTWSMGIAAKWRAVKFVIPGCDTPEQVVSRWAVLTQLNWRRFRNGELSLQGQRRERVRALLQLQLNDAEADEVFAGRDRQTCRHHATPQINADRSRDDGFMGGKPMQNNSPSLCTCPQYHQRSRTLA